MPYPRKLIVIGFDSISLQTLDQFVRRGALPTVGRLMREGCVAQTWPCFPMETGTKRDEIIEALLSARDETDRHRYRVVLPMETAGRFAVGGDRVGDIFLLAAPAPPTGQIDREAFWRSHTREETGT